MSGLAATPSIRPPHPEMENHIVMWMKKYGCQLQAARDTPDCKLLFVGDSITEHWPLEGYAPDIWHHYYSHRKVVNAGSGGDCTENILWRLENGIFDYIAPRLVVMMAGTNNTGRRMDPPEEICAGIKSLINCIHTKSPASTILIHAIFPRGRDESDPFRRNNAAANALIEQLTLNYTFVEFMNINAVFLDENGGLSEKVMPDLLHPSAAGYRLWADAIEARIQAYLEP